MCENSRTSIDCNDCSFSTVVTGADDELPADVVIEHGRESGHTLTVEPLAE
ncbi:MAG: hypothetical protein ACI8UR_002161 [Natronomonas sp.]|jgi:hypothetical protein|uniref:hypothetical protein n=1 Tax=Natronomonas sp. TaxID=2184060 RepID=UPI003988AD73